MSASVFLRDFAEALLRASADFVPGGQVILERSGLLSSTKLSLDERVQKIDSARANLQDAIDAIDELKAEADRNQQALQALTRKLNERAQEKGKLDAQIAELKVLTDVSASTVQQVFRVPTRASIWAERAIGFVIGIAASIAAAMIYARLP